MDEFTLIDRYFAAHAVRRQDVTLGIGDDGALLAPPPPGEQLVLVTDTIVSGVHFPPDLPPRAIGHRVLATNLSDIAAMGATPVAALLALSLPQVDEDWMAGFAAGFAALATAHDVALIGGDTTRAPVPVATITLVGTVPNGLALRRNGARPGDRIVVTGLPGDAAGGLAVLLGEGAPNGESSTADASGAAVRGGVSPGRDPVHDYLVGRFAFPTPRNALAVPLRALANAAIDVSDGLLADAHKLAEASGAVLEIDAARLPLSDALRDAYDDTQAQRLALTGGDDYELLFTVSPRHGDEALQRLSRATGCALTVIGEVHDSAGGAPQARVMCNGCPLSFDTGGYRHF